MTRINTIRLLLLLAIIVVFGQVVTHDFVDWDDGPLLYNNPNIVGHSFQGLLHHWEPFNRENSFMYNPMVFTMWWSISHLSEVQSRGVLGDTLNPYIFHSANLVVHWMCACVVLEILRRLKFSDWAAAAGAMVFAIHPLQTEAVAWASAMKDLLSTFFALLTIWRYIIALDSRDRTRRLNYWLSTFFFVAALLAKPSTVVVPVIVGVIHRIIYRRPFKEIALWTGPWYAFVIVITIIAAEIQVIDPNIVAPLRARPLIALDALAFYMGKLVFPIRLNFDYGRNPTAVLTDPALHHPLYWTWIFPVTLALILWRSRRRELILAGLIFVLGVLPVLGLKTFAYQYYTTVADRYVYLPMLGVALAIAWWIERHKSRATTMATCIVIVILGSLSFVQAQRWTDTETLYTYDLNDAKPIHQIILGQYQDDLALPYIRQAAAAHVSGDYEREKYFADQGIAYLNKAMAYYRTSIRLAPNDTHGYDLMARDLVRLDRFPEAIEMVKQWITRVPHSDIAERQKPGRLEGMLGMLYLQNHQYAEAEAALKQSLALQDDPDVRKLLTVAETMVARSARQATQPSTSPAVPH